MKDRSEQLRLLQETIARNPSFTKNKARVGFGISNKILNQWEAQGLVKFGDPVAAMIEGRNKANPHKTL